MKANKKITKKTIFFYRKSFTKTLFNTSLTDPTSVTITLTGTDATMR